MIDSINLTRAQRQLRLLASVHPDHPLVTVEQRIVWEEGSLRIESNQVRDVQSLAEHRAVRISRAAEPLYSAIIVPLSSDGRLHVLSRYRYSLQAWSLEFPRFDLEGGDSGWRDAAELDLFRMTGLVADRLSMLGAVHLEPALLSTIAIVILAEGCRLSATHRRSNATRLVDDESPPGEIVSSVLPLPLVEVSNLVRRGEINCGATLAALAMYRAALK